MIKRPAALLGIVGQLRGSLACAEALAVPSDRDQHLTKAIYIQSAERRCEALLAAWGATSPECRLGGSGEVWLLFLPSASTLSCRTLQ